MSPNVSQIFSELSDQNIIKLLQTKENSSTGIGGETGSIQVENKKNLYKKISLTPVELEPMIKS